MPERISEPQVKAALVKWLVQQGAATIELSLDAMEGKHMRGAGANDFPEILNKIGCVFEFTPKKASKGKVPSKFQGTYTFNQDGKKVTLELTHVAGVDVFAKLSDSSSIIAECKGGPSPSALATGGDLTSFYTCLGQLVIKAGLKSFETSRKMIVLPIFQRKSTTWHNEIKGNSMLKKMGIELWFCDEKGILIPVH